MMATAESCCVKYALCPGCKQGKHHLCNGCHGCGCVVSAQAAAHNHGYPLKK